MAKIEKAARVLLKRDDRSGKIPITGATNDHTQWPPLPDGELMLYKGEMFANIADSKLWVYMDSGITEIPVMDKTNDFTPLDTQITFMKGDKLAGSSGLTFDGTDIILNGVGMSTAISTAISAEASERISLSGETVIGLPTDGTYSDGIFPEFTPTTRLADAIDSFNEIFLLLAPAPPSAWNSTTLNILSSVFNARALTSGGPINGITDSTVPTFSVVIPSPQGLSDALSGTLTFDIDSDIKETHIINPSTPNKTTGVIRYTSGDPYVGQAGKAGFWSGFTSASIASAYSSLTPSSSVKTANYIHSTKGTLTKTFYLDSPLTVTIGTISATVPTMTRFISGVPSLATGDNITSIEFDINNVSSHFYSSTSVWQLNAGLVGGLTGDPDSIPSTYGETGHASNKTATVLTNQYSDTSFSFTVRGRNSMGTYGTNTTFTDSTKRVDTVSNESSRKTSGSGNYPSTGWGSTYDSTQSLVGTYTDEMMLKNGIYQYPNGNYSTLTSPTGPNYTGVSGIRWATFNIGTLSNNVAFTMTFTSPVGITSIGQSGLYIEIKIDGATSWVNGNAAYPGVGNPGSGPDGDPAVVVGSSTPTSRRITFGTGRSGSVIVRVGINGSGITFTGINFSL